MKRTSDGADLDESEEVYEYIACAICPVTLTKPGLAYDDGKNEIDARVRDWVVGMPEKGFVWPAFTDRSTDREHMMFFTRDVKDTDMTFMGYMGAVPRRTITQKQAELFNIVKNEMSNEDELYQKALAKFEVNLERYVSAEGKDGENLVLRGEQIERFFKNTTLFDGMEKRVAKEYEKRFTNDYATAEELLNKKMIENGMRLEERQERAKTLRRATLLIERDNQEETDLIEKLNEYIAREEH